MLLTPTFFFFFEERKKNVFRNHLNGRGIQRTVQRSRCSDILPVGVDKLLVVYAARCLRRGFLCVVVAGGEGAALLWACHAQEITNNDRSGRICAAMK